MSKRMMKKIKLDDLSKKVPFEVPEGYFDALTRDIQARITEEKPTLEWLPKLQWAMVATAAMVIVAVIWFWPGAPAAPTAEELLAEVPEQDLMAYLDWSDITESELLEGVDEEVVEGLWQEEELLAPIDLEEVDLERMLLEFETDI